MGPFWTAARFRDAAGRDARIWLLMAALCAAFGVYSLLASMAVAFVCCVGGAVLVVWSSGLRRPGQASALLLGPMFAAASIAVAFGSFGYRLLLLFFGLVGVTIAQLLSPPPPSSPPS